MNKIEILNNYEFYSQADKAKQAEFEEVAKLVELPKNAYYFHEQDICEQVALIGKGQVRVFKASESGREVTLYHVGVGQTCVLTSLCLTSNSRYTATAKVQSSVIAVVFPVAIFRKWIDDNIAVRKFIFNTMAKRITDMMLLVEEISFHKVDERLARFLSTQFAISNGMELVLTHEQIATELGSVREVISRLLKHLENQAIIELSRGKIRLNNAELLMELSSSVS